MSNSTSANNLILPPTYSPFQLLLQERDHDRYRRIRAMELRAALLWIRSRREISSPNLEKISRFAAENGYDKGNLVNSQGVATQPPEPILLEAMKVGSQSKPVAEELRERRDSATKEEVSSPKKKEYYVVRIKGNNLEDSTVKSRNSMLLNKFL
ncbi:protein TIME FOR COFFEE-like [Forsythia ovata]|uniref:Protein TIME FOR COFFEE-like n=1 Tax=Forsythia ovata TaxID=205694 RepID=A0ABD1QT28_9LAMI